MRGGGADWLQAIPSSVIHQCAVLSCGGPRARTPGSRLRLQAIVSLQF